MSYYKIIKGVRYNRELLDAAEQYTQGRGEGKISFEEIQQIYQLALDAQRITDIERRTLRYIASNYPFTDKARAWLDAKLPSEELNPVEKTLQRVLRDEYQLTRIQWKVSAEEVQRIEAEDGDRLFESALRGAVEALLNGSQGFFGFAAAAARSGTGTTLRAHLDRGTLYLVPRSEADQTALGVSLPGVLEQDGNWVFILRTPDLYPVLFVAYAHQYIASQYSLGYISRTEDYQSISADIIRNMNRYQSLDWEFRLPEITRQMALNPSQNFGHALYAAVHGAIYNGESSFSFRDFIGQEIWLDPERNLRDYMFEYIDSGKIYLIPLDYREQTQAGTAAFPIPERFNFWTEGEWIFGLAMPQRTHARFLINVPRDSDDGQTGWNDGFLDESLPLADRLQAVLTQEFNLPGLELRYNEAEYELQRTRLGYSWRHLPGLLRQALNTLLDDYITPGSMHNAVIQRHPEELDPVLYHSPQTFRAAVRARVLSYLQDGGVLELLPFSITAAEPEQFPHGETAQDNWLARAVVEKLADHWFWIVIQRRPDDGVIPYNYIG